MFSHVSLGVADLERAGAFYDATLGALGWVRVWCTSNAIGYGAAGQSDRLALKLQSGAERLRAGPGFHLAFNAPTEEAVGGFYTAALGHGGRDNGAPGLRPHYGASYFAAFVFDCDGHAIEAKVKR